MDILNVTTAEGTMSYRPENPQTISVNVNVVENYYILENKNSKVDLYN